MKKLDTLHEKVINKLLSEIEEIADVRTSFGNDEEFMSKSISLMRDVDTYVSIANNPPELLQHLNALFRARALEADREILRENSRATRCEENYEGNFQTDSVLR